MNVGFTTMSFFNLIYYGFHFFEGCNDIINNQFNESFVDFLHNPNSEQAKTDFKRSVIQLKRSVKIDSHNKKWIKLILTFVPQSKNPSKTLIHLKRVYSNLKDLHIGTPLMENSQEVSWADKLIKIFNLEKDKLNKLEKCQMLKTFGKMYVTNNGRKTVAIDPDNVSTSLYFDIRSDTYSDRNIGKLWEENFPLTQGQFINLATMLGVRIPNFSKIKFNENDRLNNFISFMDVKYKRNGGAASFHQIIYDPIINDINQGTYVQSDNKTLAFLAILNPDLNSNQLNNLFKKLMIKLSLIKPFHQHGNDQNIISFRNGLLDRKTWQLRPFKSSDNIVPKLSTDFQKKWVKHLPTKAMINKYGFNNLAIMLAKGKHQQNYKWKTIEQPFSKLKVSKRLQEFNPWHYIFNLADFNVKRNLTLYQIMLSTLQTNASHHRIMILNGGAAHGKSTFLQILTNCVGAPSVSHVSLADLSNPNKEFAASGLLGKVCNINSETTSENFLGSDSLLKMLGSKENMQINIKFHNSISANLSFEAILGACNAGIKIRNFNKADNRRLLQVQFKQTFLKSNDPSFRSDIIDSSEVTHYFADLIALCVPNFTHFTVCKEDIKAQNKQAQSANSVLHFLTKEFIPELINNNQINSIQSINSQNHNGTLIKEVNKQVIFDWYRNFERGIGDKPFGSYKFFKSFKEGLNNIFGISQPIKNTQRIIRDYDITGYYRLAKHDKYLPTDHGQNRVDMIGNDLNTRKRCFAFDPMEPLMKPSKKDKQLEAKFNNAHYVKTKDKQNILKLRNVVNGIGIVSGQVVKANKAYHVNDKWIPLSKLSPLMDSEKITKVKINSLRDKQFRQVKHNIINKFEKNCVHLLVTNNYVNASDLRNDLKEVNNVILVNNSLDRMFFYLKDLANRLQVPEDRTYLRMLCGNYSKFTLDVYNVKRVNP